LDLPRALKKMETIRSQIVWAADNQACVEKIATGEASMGICYNGRGYNFFKSGAPVALQWNATMHQGGYLFIPKGTKHLNGRAFEPGRGDQRQLVGRAFGRGD
jgi:putative spermidine/putrescine transport system substrate-binding protein